MVAKQKLDSIEGQSFSMNQHGTRSQFSADTRGQISRANQGRSLPRGLYGRSQPNLGPESPSTNGEGSPFHRTSDSHHTRPLCRPWPLVLRPPAGLYHKNKKRWKFLASSTRPSPFFSRFRCRQLHDRTYPSIRTASSIFPSTKRNSTATRHYRC